MQNHIKNLFALIFLITGFFAKAYVPDSSSVSNTVKRKSCFLIHMNTTLNGNNSRVPIENPYQKQRAWVGFDAGLTYDYAFHKNISAGIGVFHSIKSLRGYPSFNADSTYLANEFVIRRNYIEIPVYASFFFTRSNISPYFTLGIVNQIMYRASYQQFNTDLKIVVPMSELEADKNKLYNLSLLTALGFRRELPKGIVMGVEVPFRISLLQSEPRNSIYSIGLNFVMGYSF